MKYLLDTNACIVYIRYPDSGVRQKLESLPNSDVAICSVVKFEMYYGSMKSQFSQQSFALQNEFFDQFQSLPFDDVAALVCGKIRAKLASQGNLIGPFDLQIAAIAIANDLTLVTHNTGEFSRVSGLSIEDWEI